MNVKKIIVEAVDRTGQVLPLIQTDEEDFLGRHLPTTNRISYLEDRRISSFNKEKFHSRIFIGSIPYYNDPSLSEYLPHNLNMLRHAGNRNRIGVVGLQRNDSSWDRLTYKDSLETAKIFIENNVKYVPLEVPYETEIQKLKKFKSDAESILNPNQKIVLDIHSHQYRDDTEDIINFEIAEGSKFILMTCRSFNDAINLANYGTVWKILSKLKEGSEMPLVIGKGITRYQQAHSKVSSAFALNSCNINVVAERFYLAPPLTREEFNRVNPEDYMVYDISEGGFIPSSIQDALNGFPNLRETFGNLSLLEGLSPYDALLCSNFELQQQDTSFQNDAIINNKFQEAVQQKIRWKYIYENTVRPMQLRLLRS